jgi:hypothetical protein
MNNLPTLALWIIALAVGVSPGIAIFSAPSIARLLHRSLSVRPVVARKLQREREPRRPEPVGAPG